MRTTITISEDLLKKAQLLSGATGYSAAIATSIADYVSMKERLAYLESLFKKKSPHDYGKIKAGRHDRKWSSQ